MDVELVARGSDITQTRIVSQRIGWAQQLAYIARYMSLSHAPASSRPPVTLNATPLDYSLHMFPLLLEPNPFQPDALPHRHRPSPPSPVPSSRISLLRIYFPTLNFEPRASAGDSFASLPPASARTSFLVSRAVPPFAQTRETLRLPGIYVTAESFLWNGRPPIDRHQGLHRPCVTGPERSAAEPVDPTSLPAPLLGWFGAHQHPRDDGARGAQDDDLQLRVG